MSAFVAQATDGSPYSDRGRITDRDPFGCLRAFWLPALPGFLRTAAAPGAPDLTNVHISSVQSLSTVSVLIVQG